jgi:hypothetical protein
MLKYAATIAKQIAAKYAITLMAWPPLRGGTGVAFLTGTDLGSLSAILMLLPRRLTVPSFVQAFMRRLALCRGQFHSLPSWEADKVVLLPG